MRLEEGCTLLPCWKLIAILLFPSIIKEENIDVFDKDLSFFLQLPLNR